MCASSGAFVSENLDEAHMLLHMCVTNAFYTGHYLTNILSNSLLPYPYHHPTLTALLGHGMSRTRSEDSLSSSSSVFNQNMEECEHTILAVQENNQQLEEVRQLNIDIKAEQKAEFAAYVKQTAELKEKKDVLNKELQKYEGEEAQEQQRLEKTRLEHDTLRDKMERTLNDLTHGIRLYSSLGLEFQKADGECMKFVFTQICQQEPSKAFYFTMFVDENDTYQLVDRCVCIKLEALD